MAKRSEAFASTFLAQTDILQPTVVKIRQITKAVVYEDAATTKKKTTAFFDGLDKAMILNPTNWDAIAILRGENPDDADDDNWAGTEVEIYVDPSVTFKGKRTGGLRLRAPSGQMPVQQNPATPSAGLSDESKAKLGAVLELNAGRLGVDMGEMRSYALQHFNLSAADLNEANVDPLIKLFGVLIRDDDGELAYPGDQAEVPF